MIRRSSVLLALTLVAALLPAPAQARERFPRHRDPNPWEVPEHMTWSDYKPIRGAKYLLQGNEPPKTLRAALILGDF